MKNDTRRTYLQIPGPGNIPDKVRQALSTHPIDHRSHEFAALLSEVKEGLKMVFDAPDYDIAIFPGSGSGGLEAALVNVLSPGSRVLAFNQGVFSERFAAIAREFGCEVHLVDMELGHPLSESLLYHELTSDFGRSLDALLLTHTETSAGVTNDVAMVRRLLDELQNPVLLLVDAVSSLAITPLPCQELRLDVVVSASQKGLMLPGGLAILAFSQKALDASYTAMLPKSFWDVKIMLARNSIGQMPYTPALSLLFGLRESLRLLNEEGMDQVYQRHRLNAMAIRAAVTTMRMEFLCIDPVACANAVTCVRLPLGYNEAAIIESLAARGVSISGGLARLQGKLLRIGHLGMLYEAEVFAIVSVLELVLRKQGMPLRFGDAVAAAQEVYSQE